MTIVHVIQAFHDECFEIVRRLVLSARPVTFEDTEGLCARCCERLAEQLDGIAAACRPGQAPHRLIEIRRAVCVAMD